MAEIRPESDRLTEVLDAARLVRSLARDVAQAVVVGAVVGVAAVGWQGICAAERAWRVLRGDRRDIASEFGCSITHAQRIVGRKEVRGNGL